MPIFNVNFSTLGIVMTTIYRARYSKLCKVWYGINMTNAQIERVLLYVAIPY